MTEEAVKVAVRVRIFLPYEIEKKCKLVVSMTDKSTTVTHPETGKNTIHQIMII